MSSIRPIYLIQIVSTLGFSVLYSSLVLFMQEKLGIEISIANSVTGVFIAFNYALHVLGGYLGGRFFSNRMLFCVGMVAQLAGVLLLSLTDIQFLYVGLALFLTGAGINVTCLNCVLTQRFAHNHQERETAFLMNYSCMNLGFLIGFTMSGYYQLQQNFSQLFMICSLGYVIAFVLCVIYWKRLGDTDTQYVNYNREQKLKKSALGLIVVCALPFILYHLLQQSSWSNKVILTSGVAMLAICFILARAEPTTAIKNKMMVLITLMIVSTVFWTLYQIGPMGLIIFMKYNVQREFGNIIIAPQWFYNLNTIGIILGGPALITVFNKLRSRGVDVNLPSQFAMALLCIGMSYIMLPIGIQFANAEGLSSPSWIVMFYAFLCIGELLISPVGYAMIGALAPKAHQSFMMGVLMLCNGVGATLSSYCSNWMIVGQESTLPLATNANFSRVFLILGLVAVGCAALLAVFTRKLKALMQDDSKPSDEFISCGQPEPAAPRKQ